MIIIVLHDENMLLLLMKIGFNKEVLRHSAQWLYVYAGSSGESGTLLATSFSETKNFKVSGSLVCGISPKCCFRISAGWWLLRKRNCCARCVFGCFRDIATCWLPNWMLWLCDFWWDFRVKYKTLTTFFLHSVILHSVECKYITDSLLWRLMREVFFPVRWKSRNFLNFY